MKHDTDGGVNRATLAIGLWDGLGYVYDCDLARWHVFRPEGRCDVDVLSLCGEDLQVIDDDEATPLFARTSDEEMTICSTCFDGTYREPRLEPPQRIAERLGRFF